MRMGLGRGCLFGLVMLVGALSACHEPDDIRSVEPTAAVDESELDFGEVPVGEWRELDIHVRNVGFVAFRAEEVLQLSGNPSFVAELMDGASKVEPGKSKVVKVRFHPLKEGELAEKVQVTTSAVSGRQLPVRLKGLGTPTRIKFDPEVVDYETLEVDSDRTLTVTVTNPVDLPVTLKVAGDQADPFDADTVTVPPNGSVQVQTRFFPRDTGSMAARLEARSCDDCTPTSARLQGKSVASAFEFVPAPVPFEQIPVHEVTQSHTRARNITWRPVSLTKLATSDRAFTPLTAVGGQAVPPGGEVEVQMEFAARYSGPSTGTLTVNYASDKPRQAEVLLDATGGRPTLAVAPVSLDFGELPAGGKVGKLLRITNAGSNGNLVFKGVRATGGIAHFSVDPPARGKTSYPWAGGTWPDLQTGGIEIAPGTDALDLRVYFEPTAAGSFEATLILVSDDPFNPERTITLTGRATATGPCTYSLLPQPRIDFGNLPPGRGAVLGFYFHNTGPETCAIKDIHISNDAGGVFTMPGGRLAGIVAPYDTGFSAMIAFKSQVAGTFEGELELTVNNPTQPRVVLPLRAVAQASCIIATPAFVDFGPVRYDCQPQPRRTLITNACPYPVTVDDGTIGAGTSDQFSLLTPPAGLRTLQPGEGYELEFAYARNKLGQHFSPFYLPVEAEPVPRMVPLLAETNHEGIQMDRFTQGTDSQLDVLFVVSNTTTMDSAQAKLKAAVPGWLERARAANVDVRVGVTTTGLVQRGTTCPGGANGGEAGRLFPVDNSRARILSSTNANAATVLQQNLDVGLCHNLVQGLETMRQALSSPLIDSADDVRTPQPNDGNANFLRAAARAAVVVLADEDDHSGFSTESYVQFIQSLKGTGSSHRSAVYALIPTDGRCTTAGGSAPRFSDVAKRTNGAVESICVGDYGSFLDGIVKRAGGPQADFPLTQVPQSTDEMTVRVAGQLVDRTKWTYDAAKNSVVFAASAIPTSGQVVDIRYRSVCPAPPPNP
ncbi:choice-of-anchor D domain-containing protein [Aggregicoccus sp. 17bor-14]|uniref:choice-of-anchor D domain-containing protein n=1 Tax=Myxococcaceae TaxID=31 RepID=UPI00129C8272|nr:MULTISPECIES: choice-of-anchor D domain-containing protein [Myxococcaceae]MBF5044517.1 choice-of-anchor D domain-containing protein [Simulacricoccus sp. 17bor-14]MRI90262.1 choice-of-anchor D domain-containing protein [Aggregicoccus sp. 17bor-14]